MKTEHDIGKRKRTPDVRQYLNGESPRARGQAKLDRALDWLYRWGFSSATLLRDVSGQQANGFARRLIEHGFAQETRTLSGQPRSYLTLTRLGLAECERKALTLYPYPEADPYRVNQQTMRHYLIAQRATLNSMAQGLITGYETERQFAHADVRGQKRPDVVWLSGEARWGIEVELTAKWSRQLDEFVLNICRAIASGRYTRFFVLTDSPAIQTRYQNALRAETVPEWLKNNRGHWQQHQLVQLPAWLPDRVQILLLEGI